MSSYTIKMRDGSVREFKHEGRAGGSYTKQISYEPGFVVITDEYHDKVSIPSDLIAEIITHQERW